MTTRRGSSAPEAFGAAIAGLVKAGIAEDLPRTVEAFGEFVEVVQRPRRKPVEKPTHYKVLCISMYTRDIEQLEQKVAELQRRGLTKMSKSQLIRIALAKLDLDDVVGSVIP